MSWLLSFLGWSASMLSEDPVTTQAPSAPLLSIVSTLYRSMPTIDEFVERATAAAIELAGDSYEIVLVNDGSPDASLERALELAETYPNLVIADLSRNFGHHVALLEGVRQARGSLVYLIDSDLEEDPEWLVQFHRVLLEKNADVVYGYQEARKGGLFERISGAIYWSVFRRLSGLDMPANPVTCRLMTRRYVDALLQFGEVEVSIGGIFALTGFEQIAVLVRKGHTSRSTYSLRLKMWHFVNSVSAFSTTPLNAIFLLGLVVSSIGVAILAYLLYIGLFQDQSPAGWASVMASVWLIGGLLISSVGIIAIYLGKVFSEVKGRPRAIVRSITRREAAGHESQFEP